MMSQVTGAAAGGEAYARRAAAALEARDWSAAYSAGKGWVTAGGGAWLPDPWLVHAASGLLLGQPRTAVHALDVGLGAWVDDPRDRAVLLWARGALVMRRLRDPKTAIRDFTVAGTATPAWLERQLASDVGECAAAAARSRKRTPAVGPAPVFDERRLAHDTVAPPAATHVPGRQPAIWRAFLPFLTGGEDAVPADR